MGDGGEENDSKTSLESEDAAGGSQACGEGHGEGDGGAAESCVQDDGGAAESCVQDDGGAAVAAVVESFAGSLDGEAGALLSLLVSLGGRTGPGPGPGPF